MSERINQDHTVTIASSGTTSGAIDLQGLGLVGIIMPAAFTGTTISFQLSNDNTTFYDVYNTDNVQLKVTVTQGRAYLLTPGDLIGVRYLKIKSGSTESGSRTITLLTRTLA
jgi:hypothetical protein